MIFGRRNKPLIGIDITSSVIKLVELRRQDGAFRLEAYAAVPLPEGAVVESRIEKPEEVARTLKHALKQARTSTKHAAVAVSASNTITKVISILAGGSERDLEESIFYEAENHIPYPLAETRIDFEILGPAANDPSRLEVLLVAARREHVDARAEVLEMAGLVPKVVDVEAYTMEKSLELIAHGLPNHGEELTLAIVDVGATMTTLHVLVNGRIVFIREQDFGGRLLTESIQDTYDLSYAEAGRGKRENSLPEDYAVSVLEPFKRSITLTVSRALQFFFSASSQYQTVDHIFLAGGCAKIKGVAQLIEEETLAPTSVADPFAHMHIGHKVNREALEKDAPALLIACGLAMRGFD